MKKKIQILKFILPVFILLATLEVNAQKIKTSSDSLYDIAKDCIDVPMLSRTHGQAASPTFLGKELLVFYEKLFYLP